MSGEMKGKEVDREGAQSLHNIWLASESGTTPREAESASPGLPNISDLTLDASQTRDAVSIRFMASEEQIFNVHLAVNEALATQQGIMDMLQDLRMRDNRERFCLFMEQILERTDEGQVRFESFTTKIPPLPPPNSSSAHQMNLLVGNSGFKGWLPNLKREATRGVISE